MREGLKRTKKSLAILITVTMILTMLPIMTFAAPSDLNNHWARNVIEEWVNRNLIGGYPDGTFKPDNAITRAEFMVLVNKAFGFQTRGTVSFTDVPQEAWFHNAVAIAANAGYIGGYPDGTMKPNNPISRQETAIIISKITELEASPNSANRFQDALAIADWSRGAVGAVVEAGYMGGYPDGTFKPVGNITRAEAVVALNKVLVDRATPVEEVEEVEEPTDAHVYNEAGTYGPEVGVDVIQGDVTVKAANVVLQNMVIKGDLIIAEEVGNGDVTLNNITVEGDTFIRGGGKDSIHINGGSFKRIIVQETSSGNVRIVATNVAGLEIVVAEAAQGQEIILEGNFERVTIEASNVSLRAQGETNIAEVIVKKEIENIRLYFGFSTNVEKLVADSKVQVVGEGRIEAATGLEVRSSSFQRQPAVVTVPAAGGGGGGGGGSMPQALTVSSINMIVDGANAGRNLSSLDDSARVSGIRFTVNADESELEITGITSTNMGSVSANRTIVFTSTSAEVTVEQLLGFDQDSVRLGTLRSAFGNQVTIQGRLTAIGYSNYTTPIIITLGGSSSTNVVNEWATVSQSGNEITATIKSGKGNTKLSDIEIVPFLMGAFNQLPSEVKIEENSMISVTPSNYEVIKGQLGDLGGGWDQVKVSDLVDAKISFKAMGSTTEYKLKVVS